MQSKSRCGNLLQLDQPLLAQTDDKGRALDGDLAGHKTTAEWLATAPVTMATCRVGWGMARGCLWQWVKLLGGCFLAIISVVLS